MRQTSGPSWGGMEHWGLGTGLGWRQASLPPPHLVQRQVVLQRIVRMEGLGALGAREAVLAVHFLVLQKLVLRLK